MHGVCRGSRLRACVVDCYESDKIVTFYYVVDEKLHVFRFSCFDI
jgi:hypothetical protein